MCPGPYRCLEVLYAEIDSGRIRERFRERDIGEERILAGRRKAVRIVGQYEPDRAGMDGRITPVMMMYERP